MFLMGAEITSGRLAVFAGIRNTATAMHPSCSRQPKSPGYARQRLASSFVAVHTGGHSAEDETGLHLPNPI